MPAPPFALHIPDGFLSPEVALLAWVPALAAVAYGLRVAGRDLEEERVPLLGVIAAFVFAVQMLNFPVAGGTSGHLLGAALAAVLLGPWLACVVMAVVLTAQALVFADGGITALGANVLNMGVLGALLAGLVIAALAPLLPRGRAPFLALVAVTSWLAVMAGAAATAAQLALSGTVPLDTVLPAMLGVHVPIAIGEAVITVAAVSAVMGARPDLVARPRAASASTRSGLAVAAVLVAALALAPLASSAPDGLERVAADHGFLGSGEQRGGPIPDYAFPGVGDPAVATLLAGLAGTLGVLALGFGSSRVLRRRP